MEDTETATTTVAHTEVADVMTTEVVVVVAATVDRVALTAMKTVATLVVIVTTMVVVATADAMIVMVADAMSAVEVEVAMVEATTAHPELLLMPHTVTRLHLPTLLHLAVVVTMMTGTLAALRATDQQVSRVGRYGWNSRSASDFGHRLFILARLVLYQLI